MEENPGLERKTSLESKSMWGVKSLLLEGLGWRVGNGRSIDVRRNKWIKVDGHFSSLKLIHNDMANFMVGDLIHHDDMVWDIGKVRNLFEHNTVKAILSIPLSICGGVDRMF